MADKISTLELTVDIHCKQCCEKISKTLCSINGIEQLTFNEKQKKVIISGRFDAECLIKSLYCKLGCKIIKSYNIPKPPPPQPPQPPKEPTPPPPPPPPPKQPIYVGPVYVAPICICGRPCGGACKCTQPSPCHECRSGDGNSHRFCSEEDPTCKLM